MLASLVNVSADMAAKIADGLGMEALPPAATPAQPVQDLAPSVALSIIDNAKDTLAGRCVAILVDNGSDGAAIAGLKKAVLDAGARVKIVAPKVGGAVLRDDIDALTLSGQGTQGSVLTGSSRSSPRPSCCDCSMPRAA